MNRAESRLSILVTWEMGDGYGHLKRLQPIVRQLQHRGHRVFLATRDVARTHAVFPDLPCYQAPFHASGVPDFPYANTLAEVMHNAGCANPDSIRLVASGWEALAELIEPDVVIMDFSPMALIAFQGRPVRRILIDNGYSHPSDTPHMAFLRPWEDAYPDMHERTERKVLGNVNEYLRDRGLASLPYLAALFRRVHSINLITIPELDHTGPKPDAHYRGYLHSGGGDPPVWPETPHPAQRIFVYLKPFPNLDQLLGKLSLLKQAVLVVVPGCGEDLRAKYRSVPGLLLTEKMFDIETVAEQTDYALCSGGDTVGILLLHGVPVCVLPFSPEQRLTALRAVATGAAVSTPNNPPILPTADAIVDTLQRLIANPAHMQRARDLEHRYQDLGPVHQVAEIVAAIEARHT